MAIQVMILDPDAQAYTDNQIVDKINTASNNITRASSVSTAARPIGAGEVTSSKLSSTAAKDNLDALTDTARGYIKTNPTTGQFKIVALERQADGKMKVEYDDVAI